MEAVTGQVRLKAAKPGCEPTRIAGQGGLCFECVAKLGCNSKNDLVISNSCMSSELYMLMLRRAFASKCPGTSRRVEGVVRRQHVFCGQRSSMAGETQTTTRSSYVFIMFGSICRSHLFAQNRLRLALHQGVCRFYRYCMMLCSHPRAAQHKRGTAHGWNASQIIFPQFNCLCIAAPGSAAGCWGKQPPGPPLACGKRAFHGQSTTFSERRLPSYRWRYQKHGHYKLNCALFG